MQIQKLLHLVKNHLTIYCFLYFILYYAFLLDVDTPHKSHLYSEIVD